MNRGVDKNPLRYIKKGIFRKAGVSPEGASPHRINSPIKVHELWIVTSPKAPFYISRIYIFFSEILNNILQMPAGSWVTQISYQDYLFFI